MKYSFLILTLLALVSCSMPDNNSEENVRLVNAYTASVENLEYQKMESFLADDYMGYGPSIQDSISKNDAIENWKYVVENLYSSIKYERNRSVAVSIPEGENEGEWVSNWAELTIKYKNTPETVVIWSNTIYKIKNGKIVRSYTFYNEADVYRQLGYGFINLKE